MARKMKTRTEAFEGHNYAFTRPLQAIRAKCIDCSGGDLGSVRLCPSRDCELFPFRMGKNPFMGVRHARSLQDNVELQQTDDEGSDLSEEEPIPLD